MRVHAGAHPSTMDVTVRNSSYCGLLTVSGELDIETAPQLTKVLDWLCQQPHHQVTVDLRQVTFIDSSGLGALIRAQHALAAESGRLVLSGPSRPVHHLLDITGLGREFALQ